MLDGSVVVRAIEEAGFTHVVWIPDSHLGTWDAAMRKSRLQLILPAREGEAVAIAGGLQIGGAKPLIVFQCTGFFEAGDAVRNFVHDLKLPLKFVIGVRSAQAAKSKTVADNCPHFAEPLVKAWELPVETFDVFATTNAASDCQEVFQRLYNSTTARSLLWTE